MKSYYQDPPNYIWNDRIALYKTSDSKKNSNWFYRFTNPMTRTGYIRKSTRTNDFGEASSKAIAHYTELELRGRFGAVTEHTTIRLLLKTFGDEVTSSVLRHWNLCYQAYWKPYWAKRDLFNVTDDDIKQYIKWRTDAKNIKYTRYGKNKKHGNWIDINDRTISVETLRKDLRGLKYLFKRAFSKKMIANAPHFPRLKQNTMNVVDLPDQQKRARLTEEQAKQFDEDKNHEAFAGKKAELNKAWKKCTNIKEYEKVLSRMSMTISQFELQKAEEINQDLDNELKGKL